MKKILFTNHRKMHLDTLIHNVNNELMKDKSELLIVMKPNLQIMMDLCSRLEEYKNRIILVIQINSANTVVLKMVDPYAPYFIDRHSALKYAFENGFRTAVEAVPVFDNSMIKLVNEIKDFVTDFIHIDILTKKYIDSFPNYTVKQILRVVAEFYEDKETLQEIQKEFSKYDNVLFGDNLKKSFQNVL